MIAFYSWQTDADRKLNKDFIHAALTDAITQLNAEIDVNSAEREIELDQDAKGIMGAPSIANVIFDKIRVADEFVADVSLIAQGTGEKRHVNSNVAIELGYAFGVLGDEPVLNIMNTAFGEPEQLPFDLRSRRHPVCYSLKNSASKAEIKTEKEKLVGKLKPILRGYAKKPVEQPENAAELHSPEVSTFVKTAFWGQHEPIAEAHTDQKPLYCESTHLVSIRLIPEKLQSRMTAVDCKAAIRNCLPPLFTEGSYSISANKWGAMTHMEYRESQTIMSGFQLFKSREIWLFANEFIWLNKSDDADRGKCFIHDDTIMEYLPEAIDSAISLGKRLINGKSQLVLTAANLSDVYVKSGEYMAAKNNKIHEPVVELRFDTNQLKDSNDVAFEFAKQIYAEAGVPLRNRMPTNRYS